MYLFFRNTFLVLLRTLLKDSSLRCIRFFRYSRFYHSYAFHTPYVTYHLMLFLSRPFPIVSSGAPWVVTASSCHIWSMCFSVVFSLIIWHLFRMTKTFRLELARRNRGRPGFKVPETPVAWRVLGRTFRLTIQFRWGLHGFSDNTSSFFIQRLDQPFQMFFKPPFRQSGVSLQKTMSNTS